jgi:hypothetical protein
MFKIKANGLIACECVMVKVENKTKNCNPLISMTAERPALHSHVPPESAADGPLQKLEAELKRSKPEQ